MTTAVKLFFFFRLQVTQHQGKPVKFLIEQVRDGSTVRGFLLPDFQFVTIMLSGIKVFFKPSKFFYLRSLGYASVTWFQI